MADKALPCPSVLRQLLRYDAETGKLFWRHRGEEWFDCPGKAARWNGRRAGQEAFVGVHRQGYKQGQLFGHSVRAHRVVWAIIHGYWPSVIDHIDGNVTNNRIENLRQVTQAENCRNAKMRKDNTSGCVGVRWHKANRKWIAVLGSDYIGSFETIEAARRARSLAEERAGYHENHGRH